MKIRLIVSDLDDTLLNERAEISPRTEAALAAAREAGAQIALASGRMVVAMRRYARQLKIDTPMIAYNGAVLADPTDFRFVEHTPIPHDLAEEVLSIAESRGLYAQVYLGDVCYAAEPNPSAILYGKAVGITVEYAHMPLSAFMLGDTTKLLIVDEPAVIATLGEEFRARFEGRLRCESSRPRYLEMTIPSANKGDMIARLAKHLGVPLESVAAFGDGQNDVSMLRTVGYGCCVRNARDEVRAQCERFCPANTEDGVAQEIESLLASGAIGGETV